MSKLRALRFVHEIDFEEITRFRGYASRCRDERPIPAPSAFTLMEQAQQQIVADWLHSWQRQRPEAFAKQTVKIGSFEYVQKPRLAIFSSNMPGLAVAQNALDPPPPNLLMLLDEEYEWWIKQPKNNQYESHWHFFCEFRPVFPPLLRERGVTYDPALTYWEQYSGTMIAGLAGSGEFILWQWDGQTATKCDSSIHTWDS